MLGLDAVLDLYLNRYYRDSLIRVTQAVLPTSVPYKYRKDSRGKDRMADISSGTSSGSTVSAEEPVVPS
jgi:hypothetical protein